MFYFRDISLCLLTYSDAPTLVEATRFLSTVLSNDKCKDVWLKAWNSDLQYGENIVFILRSSVNSKYMYTVLMNVRCVQGLCMFYFLEYYTIQTVNELITLTCCSF